MIDGGAATLRKLVNFRFEQMIDGEEVTSAIVAGIFAEALRKDQSPLEIAQDIWKALPSDEAWKDGLEGRVREAIEQIEEEQ